LFPRNDKHLAIYLNLTV